MAAIEPPGEYLFEVFEEFIVGWCLFLRFKDEEKVGKVLKSWKKWEKVLNCGKKYLKSGKKVLKTY